MTQKTSENRRAKNRKFLSASEVLYPLLQRYRLDDKLALYEFSLRWAEIVGDVVGKRSTPLYVKGDRLFLEVESSVWAQELSFMKSEMMSRIKLYLRNKNEASLYVQTLRVQLLSVSDISFIIARR